MRECLEGNGKRIDVYAYEGLIEENIVRDISQCAFADDAFDSVPFIANLNHVPKPLRDIELAEAYRVLRKGEGMLS